LPTDVAREHVQMVSSSRDEYSIDFRENIDGAMTRAPIGYAAFKQGWQPNRSVQIENVGTTDVHNPWLTVNGRRNWRTLESIVAEAARGAETDPERARAIWEFARKHRFHACTWDNECSDAIKALNVYGYTLCGNQALMLDDLWTAAGLQTRRAFPRDHVVGEVFYDGGYHLMDGDEHIIFLLRDNKTIASAEDIVRDHDLVKRTHTYGIGSADSRRMDDFSGSLYGYEGDRGKKFESLTRH
jgi:hypothetical protein